VPVRDPAHEDEAGFVFRASRDLDKRFVTPQSLSLDEVDPVLGLVGLTLLE